MQLLLIVQYLSLIQNYTNGPSYIFMYIYCTGFLLGGWRGEYPPPPFGLGLPP